MRQDEQGRWVSDDGQWIWDGNAWQPREASGVAPAAPAAAWADPDATQIHTSTAVGPIAGPRPDDGYGGGHSSAQVAGASGAADDSSVTRIVSGVPEAAAGQEVGGGPIGPSGAGAHVADTSRWESRPQPGGPGEAAIVAWEPDFSDEGGYSSGNLYGAAGHGAADHGAAGHGAPGYGTAHGAVGYDPAVAQPGPPVPAGPYGPGASEAGGPGVSGQPVLAPLYDPRAPGAGGPGVPGQPGGFAPGQYAGAPWPPPGGPAGGSARRGWPAWLMPLIAVLVVIGVAVAVFFLLRSDNKSSSTSPSAQQTGPAVTAPSGGTGLPSPAEASLPGATGLPSVSASLPGTFTVAAEQAFMNSCVAGGKQAYCACALTALENQFTFDEYSTFEQQYDAGDPTARAKLQQIKDSCASQLPGG